jgi:predicted AlkP superfamily pyrophosphatase or phosphodiesterase
MIRLLFLLFFALAAFGQPHKLLVVSIDGLDHRYLRDADKLGLKIPTLRRLLSEGALADGVVGIVPTVTWPSHTTILTGVPAWQHGILTNDQPGQPGQRWWFTKFLKARTLWHAAGEKKLKTAAIFWPVTVGAAIDFNIPEFWIQRQGHSQPLEPIEKHSTPGLTDRISRAYPSFAVEMFSDRPAFIAARFLLEQEQPDLTLLHVVDLDGEQHATGAFSRHARAMLEYQDELLGWVLQALPPRTVVAIVSDHGFETQAQVYRPRAALREARLPQDAAVSDGLVGALTVDAAGFFRKQIGKGVLAREVPIEEVRRMAPHLKSWVAAFETGRDIIPNASEESPALGKGSGGGVHGLWPTRADYRASFLLWGPGIRQRRLPQMSMLDEGPTFAEILGVSLPDAVGRSVWGQVR